MEKKFMDLVYYGDIENTQKMLESGFNPNINYNGRISLIEAIRTYEGIEMLKLLIENGADPNMSDGLYTPLHISCRRGYTKSVEYLLNAGANPNVSDDNGYTPLISASLYGYDNRFNGIIELLLNAGANINSTNNRHETALICSVHSCNLEITKILINHGPKPFIKNNFGENVQQIARKKNKLMIKIIEEYMMLFKMARRCQKFIKYKKNKKILAYKNLAICKLFEMYDVDEPLCKHMRKTNIVSVYG